MIATGVLDLFTGSAWAMEPHVFAQLLAVIDRHVTGSRLSADELGAVLAAEDSPRNRRPHGTEPRYVRNVAVIPVHGVISKRAAMVGGLSQPRGTSVEAIREGLDAAMADPGVAAIVLDVDSPGGSVDGIHELAADIRRMRETKPIAAHVDGMAASAAYWLASQAQPLNATAGSLLGSVGVYATVTDSSRAADARGLSVHVIGSAPGKGDGTPGTPWTDEQAGRLQARVNAFHALFLDAIEAGRDTTARAASVTLGGDVMLGAAAVAAGLADGVANFMDTVRTVGTPKPAAATSKDRTMTNPSPAPTPAAVATSTSTPAPTPAPAAVAAPAADAEAAAATRSARKVAAERERCASIAALATASQTAMAARLIADGTEWPAARVALTSDPRRNAHVELAAAAAATNEPFDQGADTDGAPDNSPQRRKFRADPIAVATFGDTDKGFAQWLQFESSKSRGAIRTKG